MNCKLIKKTFYDLLGNQEIADYLRHMELFEAILKGIFMMNFFASKKNH